MTVFDGHSNFGLTTVSGAPSPATSGTSLTITSATNFPDPASVGAYNAVIWATGALPLSTNAEIVRVTAKSGTTLTITRAQESSSARTVINGDNIAIVVTKKTLTDVEGAIATLETGPVSAAWTPTITQSGAVTKTVTYGKYFQIGKLVFASALLSITGSGTGANQVTLSLPVTAAAGSSQAAGHGYLYDSSAATVYSFTALLASTTTANLLQLNVNGFLGSTGFTAGLASGDLINIFLTYEAA